MPQLREWRESSSLCSQWDQSEVCPEQTRSKLPSVQTQLRLF